MSKLDTPGTYRGEVTEHSLGTTKKGYPQFVARLKATQKYVEEKSDLDHFVGQGVIEEATPQWIDWTAFDEETVAFLVLFNDADVFDENSMLMNYEQLQLALGWDGTEFDSLNNDSHVGKTVLFRVEEDEYEGKVQLKVNWIDSHDASPTRELRKLDDDKVKDLSGKLKVAGKGKPAKPAKPAEKPEAPAEPAAKPSGPPSKPKSKPAAEAEPEAPAEPAEPTSDVKTALPTECSQTDAWEFVCENKGDTSDSDVEEAWIAACNAIGGDTDEDDFTEQQWAAVRDHVIDALALNV